ncbi:MAG: hypothetical protein RLZZ450_803 [Pseudomonadota bacterium]
MLVIILATRVSHGDPHVETGLAARYAQPAPSTSVVAYSTGLDTVLHATLNHCPHVTVEATPVLAYTFQQVRVHSMSFDPEGDALTYEWIARPDGTFASPRAILTTYQCGSEGVKELAARVTDARGCTSIRKVRIRCVPPGFRSSVGRPAP